MSNKPTDEALEGKAQFLKDPLAVEKRDKTEDGSLPKEATDEEASIGLQILVDASPGIALVIDATCRIMALNQAGLDTGAVLGGRCFSIWHGSEERCIGCRAAEALRENRAVWSELENSDRNWLMIWAPLSEDLLFHAAVDVSRGKRLEDQKRQHEKMEDLGSIARGISNDFNNILTGIKGYTSLMLKDIHMPDLYREQLKALEEYTVHAEHLTRQLLEFAAVGDYHLRLTDINEIVDKHIRLLDASQREFTYRSRFEEKLWQSRVDEDAIGRALTHICQYAQQTMPGGGELLIRTENIELDQASVKPYGTDPGRFVSISISDTGLGIDDKTQNRLFDPFYIAEQMGWQIGLGLSSASGIIRSHGGFLDINSTFMEGTTYRICLPADLDNRRQQLLKTGRGKTILLVDDMDVIVEVGEEMIRNLGYRCLTAQSGRDAIHLYKTHHGAIDLVILDMILPEMEGKAIFDHLRKVDPGARILLTSGYGVTDRVKGLLSRGGVGYIQKPFDILALSERIGTILAE